MPKRSVRERIADLEKVRCADPLRSPTAAARWIAAAAPAPTPCSCSAKRSTSSRRFPGGRRAIGPAPGRARCSRIDARVEAPRSPSWPRSTPLHYQRSTSVETRLWHGVFDLGQGLHRRVPGGARRAGHVGARERQAVEGGPAQGACCASRTTRDSTASSASSATGHSIPAQWRDVHALLPNSPAPVGWRRDARRGGRRSPTRDKTQETRIRRDAAPHASRQRQLHARPGRSGWRASLEDVGRRG